MISQPLEIRKSLGKAHLQVDRIAEALEVYAGILQDYPEDLETYMVLGDCYLASGDAASAIRLYQQAQCLSPEDQTLNTRLSLAKQEQLGNPDNSETNPADPAAVSRLLDRLREDCQTISSAELARAVKMLQHVTKNPYPANVIATHLDEIATLLPAFIELNIRQAHADGRPDIAEALRELASSVHEPGDEAEADLNAGSPSISATGSSELPGNKAGRLLLIAPTSLLASPRLTLPAEALADRGWEVTLSGDIPRDIPDKFDIVVAHRPHGMPSALEGMATCVGTGIPLVVDLDIDFEQMPLNHPEYPSYGLGTSVSAKAYAAALQMADQIIVPSESLAMDFEQGGLQAATVPDGWSRNNPLWEKPADRRPTINLGWFGMPGQIDDVLEIRRPLMRILREFPQTRLVIGIDAQVYQLFDNLPESQKLFLPADHARRLPLPPQPDRYFIGPAKKHTFQPQYVGPALNGGRCARHPMVGRTVPRTQCLGVRRPDRQHSPRLACISAEPGHGFGTAAGIRAGWTPARSRARIGHIGGDLGTNLG